MTLKVASAGGARFGCSAADFCPPVDATAGRGIDVGYLYPSDEPLWRMRAGMPDIGMDENWISGLPEPSDAAAVHRAVLPDGRRCVREHL